MAKCIHPEKRYNEKYERFDVVACGRCIDCTQNKRADWSFRDQYEFNRKDTKSAKFITLTLENEHQLHNSEGESTLWKQEPKNFIKRIRNEQNRTKNKPKDIHKWPKFAYHGCAEYGKNTQRAHYHILLFNAYPDIIENLHAIWGKGHVRIDPINTARIHYISKYQTKFQAKEIQEQTKEQEFQFMSQSLGIGYVEQHKAYHQAHQRLEVFNTQTKRFQIMPRYYRDKIFTEEQLERIRQEAFDKFPENDRNYWEALIKDSNGNPLEVERQREHHRQYLAQKSLRSGYL